MKSNKSLKLTLTEPKTTLGLEQNIGTTDGRHHCNNGRHINGKDVRHSLLLITSEKSLH